MVAVGAVPYISGRSFIYNGTGYYSPSLPGGWYDNWNKYVAPRTYQYGSTVYLTSNPFDDDPSNSVDKIAYDNIARAGATPNLIIIVLDKYQPSRRRRLRPADEEGGAGHER